MESQQIEIKPVIRKKAGKLTVDSLWLDSKTGQPDVIVTCDDISTPFYAEGKYWTQVRFDALCYVRHMGEKTRATRNDGTLITKRKSFNVYLHVNENANEVIYRSGKFASDGTGERSGKFEFYPNGSDPEILLHLFTEKQRKTWAIQAYFTVHPLYEPIPVTDNGKPDKPRFAEIETLNLADYRKSGDLEKDKAALRESPVQGSSTTPAELTPVEQLQAIVEKAEELGSADPVALAQAKEIIAQNQPANTGKNASKKNGK